MNKADVWVVIPAAGVGKRMNADVPKQYLSINKKTVLQHTVEQFINLPFVKGILVAISSNDNTFKSLTFSIPSKVQHCIGGKERYNSVLNTLKHFENSIADDDWIMVHDAARPCISRQDIEKLYSQCNTHAVGGILAVPVKDTLKSALPNERTGESTGKTTSKSISKTIDRSNLWHALTPQMFRNKALIHAIEKSISNKQSITDDASAFENVKQHPKLVDGSEDNIKITRPSDLNYAKWILTQRQNNDA